MARSRYYVERQVARTAVRFGAPIHITTNDFFPLPLEDEAQIHGKVHTIGPDYLRLTDAIVRGKEYPAYLYSIPWGCICGIEVYSEDIPRRG